MRSTIVALMAAICLSAMPSMVQAAGYQMGYHPAGQYFGGPTPGYYHGPPPHPYVAKTWTGNYNQQTYYPSQRTNYATGGFRGTTLSNDYSTSGVYRVNY